MKKLSLKKEVITSLQEKQMKSLIGGQALASKGSTAAYTCGGDSCFCPEIPITKVSESVEDQVQPGSCCQRSCN